ncbi:ROK family transcriptional regulator [Streptomyces sp. CA2R106]|uniref:ROK family transcriptional regulator n=1 Tax=Streptomyces sp. CA2R106 TaxID=3120153 RepID=UPI00300A9FA0
MPLDDQPPAASLVLRTLLQGPLTRAEIGRRTGLSPGAVTKVASPLLADGWLTELGGPVQPPTGERASGRPATPLAVRPDRAHFVGVKVTADELIGVLTDLTARPLATGRTDLRSHDVVTVVADLARLVARLRADGTGFGRGDVHSIGVTLAGDVDARGGTVRYSPFLDWRQVPLAALVGAATGTPVLVENDVRALTVAEQWFGAGVGLSSFALVTVGAGIGCGLSVGGRVVSGAYGVSGELGHLALGGTDRVCTCGNTGCVEAVASSRAITEQAREAAGDPELSMPGAVRLAYAGHREVRAVFARAGRAMGLALAAVANLVGPQRIVISGEGVSSYDLYEEEIRQTFAARAFGAAAECDLLVRPLPFEEWARGGAAVAVQHLLAPPAPAGA